MRVLVGVRVYKGVAVFVGVLVGLGVRVLVGVLVLVGGAGRRVGARVGTVVTTRVVPGVVVSTTSTIITGPAVPIVVGVGNLSTVISGGPNSHAANTTRPHKADIRANPSTRLRLAPAPLNRENRNMA